MGALFSQLISLGVLQFLGIGVLGAMIWFYGPLLRFGSWDPLGPPMNRIIVIVALFVGYILVRIFKAWRNRKKSEEISKDLAQGAAAVDPNQEQSEEEMAELKGRFDEALKVLKKSEVGGKKVRSIYQLPWYIIIGPPGSGKTTLLINSGLQFPLADSLGDQKVQGVGGTRYCDWWFTDEAVLIDTAGRYTTQDSNEAVDNSAWLGFLKLLKKHRARRPINGIILAISTEELLRQSERDKERAAKAISDRIQELYDKLGVRFPIYLMFTKTDLLAGFMEYFGDLDRNERAQVWGFTLGLDENPIDSFDHHFADLQQRLEERLVQRLQDERDVQRRELIYNFPIQMSSSGEAIKQFLGQVFKPSRYKTTPLLRGLYFTSGTQEGTPFNRIMSQLASNFSLSRSATQSMPSKGKAYFIRDLMMKVIFGESGLAGANLKVERMYGLARKAGWAAIIAIPILLNVLWWVSSGANKDLIAEVDTSADAIRETIEDVKPSDASMRGILPLLNEARKLPVGYEASFDSAPLHMRWGLYQGHRLGDNGTIPAYDRVLENAFLPRLMIAMEQDLSASMNDPNRVYELLKAYLMLGTPDRLDEDYVREVVVADWERDLTRVMTNEQLEELKGHLDALLDLQPLTPPFDLDRNLVTSARIVLGRTTLSQRIYSVIKSENIDEGEPFSLGTMTGPDGPLVFTRSSGAAFNNGVPAFFSPQGYQEMYLPAEQDAIEQVQDESWIFATEATDAVQISETDLINGIRLSYLEDYVRTWIEFLEDVRVRPFSGMDQAASILLVLSGDTSPLRQLLVNVSNATRLTPEEVIRGAQDDASLREKFEAILRSQGTDPDLVDPAMVDRSFAGVHALAEQPQDGRPSPLDGLIADLDNLYRYIETLSRASADALIADMQNEASSALTAVRQRGQRTPAPIRDWVLDVVSQSDNLIAGDASTAIQAAWSSEVAPFCRQAINGRYPFSRDNRTEVPLYDFGTFFAPGTGILDKFFNEYLTPVVDTTTPTWSLRPAYANSIRIKPSSLRYMQQAKQIQRAFFASGGTLPSVTFEMRPVRLDAAATNFTLSINGESTSYSHGPIIAKTFRWPGDAVQGMVGYQFVPASASGRSGDSETGPWSLFRMFDRSGLRPSATSEAYLVRFELDERWAEYEVRAASAFNPFDMSDLRSFRCPDQL